MGTVVWIKANISATDPLHKLRARYKGAYIVTKETHSQVHVVPWGLRETILDKSPLHILGQGKPQIRRTAQKVDKSRLKRHEGLSPYNHRLGRAVKESFLQGWDLLGVTYKELPWGMRKAGSVASESTDSNGQSEEELESLSDQSTVQLSQGQRHSSAMTIAVPESKVATATKPKAKATDQKGCRDRGTKVDRLATRKSPRKRQLEIDDKLISQTMVEAAAGKSTVTQTDKTKYSPPQRESIVEDTRDKESPVASCKEATLAFTKMQKESHKKDKQTASWVLNEKFNNSNGKPRRNRKPPIRFPNFQ